MGMILAGREIQKSGVRSAVWWDTVQAQWDGEGSAQLACTVHKSHSGSEKSAHN